MLSTVILVLLCVYNAKTAKKLGKKPGLCVLLTIGLWLAAEVVGVVVGSLLAGLVTNDLAFLALFFLPVFLCGLLGAGAAVLITRHRKAPKQGRAPVTYGFCPNCGKPVAEGSAFCKFCGNPIPVSTAPILTPKPEKKKGKGLKIALICGGCGLVAAGLVIGILNLLPAAKNRRAYEAAMAAYNEGNYEEAETAFAALSGYEDAFSMEIRSRQMQDYTNALTLSQSAVDSDLLSAAELFESLGDFMDAPECAENCRREVTYCRAAEFMAQEDYEQAAKLFTSVEAYRDSALRAEECLNLRDYDRAVQLMEAGDYAYALELFRVLDDYRDSTDRAIECQNHVDYDVAWMLLNEEKYEEAAVIFERLSDRDYEGAADMLDYCKGAGVYEKAEALYNEEKYYEARRLFLSIPDYQDATEKAEVCIRENPGSKELYRNPDYSKKSVTFKVRNTSDDNAVVKMYKNGDLVTMFFIPAGKTTSVKIPAGTYTINRGFGQEWYGNEDLFGDEGRYYKLNINGQTEFDFDSGYIYELGSTDGGTAVGQQSTGRENC